MLLFWRIRYLDTRDKQFKDRDLWLDTDSLDCVMKAAVEAMHALQRPGHTRGILRYRHLFCEQRDSDTGASDLCLDHSDISTFCIPDYFEDESGKELTTKQIAEIVTGCPTAIMLPAGAKQHDIDYILADNRPIPIAEVSLSRNQLEVLGYFTRDLREMLASAFYTDGPGTLTSSGGSHFTIRTAVTDEEIRSFVTIFRRLYMAKEPANFIEAVTLFSNATSGYRLGNWVKGVGTEYQDNLNERPDFAPMRPYKDRDFTCKRLIDVFLYTRYAHQPKKERTRQYQECLASVGGEADLLFWLFLSAMWHCALHMRNAGVIIASFYERYCAHHRCSPELLVSVGTAHPHIGALEKKEVRRARILREKAEELAMTLWQQRGRPEGGLAQFFNEARDRLNTAVLGEADQEDES